MLLAAEFIADRELAPLAKQRKAHQRSSTSPMKAA